MMPQLEPVNSDMASAAGYDPMEGVLVVKFRKNGHVFTYRGVSQDAYNALMAAPSFGKHFAAQIRPHHTGVKA